MSGIMWDSARVNEEEGTHWGERVRAARKAADLSAEQLAAELGYSSSHLFKMERLAVRPTQSNLVGPLEKRLGVDPPAVDRSSDPQHWGRQVRRAYEAEGFTRTGLARALRCSISELQRLERLPKRPEVGRYVGPLERLLSLGAHSPVADLEVARALTRATKVQLVRALTRILEKEEAEERAQGDRMRQAAQQVPGFTGSDDLLRGTGEPGDPELRGADSQVTDDSGTDGTPPTGAVES